MSSRYGEGARSARSVSQWRGGPCSATFSVGGAAADKLTLGRAFSALFLSCVSCARPHDE